MTHHARNIAFLPNIAEACDRIAARAKAENEGEELLATARAIMARPTLYSDDDVLDACTYARTHGDGMDWQRADQLVYAIRQNQRIARNRAAALPVDETPLRIAMRHGARWPDIIAGAVAFVAYAWVLFTLGAMIVEAL
jgi:hypothetical protein